MLDKIFAVNELLPVTKLQQLSAEKAAEYRCDLPYAHGVYDDIFSPEVLDTVVQEFDLQAENWFEFKSKYELKMQMNRDQELGQTTRSFIHSLNSEPFLRFLESLTGISGLISDPYLEGGGLHNIRRGGKLGIHVDFNKHSTMRVYRRVNVLIYLNRDWQEEWGGHFELWGSAETGAIKKVLPVFNRMAIFNTTNSSFHGHPNPLSCPDDVSRKSIALYYYTAEDPGEQDTQDHSTLFLNENGQAVELQYSPSLLQRLKRKLFG